MQDFRNLEIWHRATNLNKTVDEMTADFPESQAFGLRRQMRRASASICSDIAARCGQQRDREVRHFLEVAMGSACELEWETIVDLLRELRADS
jgi:four helix bundle protein